MKIVKQGYALSDDDLQMMDPKILTEMMKHRLVVEFPQAPDINQLDFSGCQGFYHIKSLGSKLYQFWFHKKSDYDAFYNNVITYKLSLDVEDK